MSRVIFLGSLPAGIQSVFYRVCTSWSCTHFPPMGALATAPAAGSVILGTALVALGVFLLVKDWNMN
jgi:hypothetical protein